MACLKEEGKVLLERQRLRRVVIGGRRESMQDFTRKVGTRSREEVELFADRISFRTSDCVVGEKVVRSGGGEDGGR